MGVGLGISIKWGKLAGYNFGGGIPMPFYYSCLKKLDSRHNSQFHKFTKDCISSPL